MVDAALIATPQRPPAVPDCGTRPAEPESASQRNIQHPKRRQVLDNRAPPPARPNLCGGAATQTCPGVANSVATHFNAARRALQARESVTKAIAKAIDNALKDLKSPEEQEFAQDARQRVIHALTTPIASGRTSPSTDRSSSDTNARARRTWADIAATPKTSGESGYTTSGSDRSKKQPSRATRLPQQHERERERDDPRIFITVPMDIRAARPSPYGVRQAICAATGLSMQDIPKASQTASGWAITPANQQVRDSLMVQERKEQMIRALDGQDARLPQRWYNYAVPGVESRYLNLQGQYIPTTQEMVIEEVSVQTGAMPVRCHPAKSGVNTQTQLMTWIVSFLAPVRPFQLFGTSSRAKEIKHKPVIERHETGCQGFCNPRKCTRAPLCSKCSKPTAEHDPAAVNDYCAHPDKCANCHGPHRPSDNKCPAAPRRERGRVIRLTKKELSAVRRAGDRAYDAHHRTVEQTLQEQLARTAAEDDAPATQGTLAPVTPGPSQTQTRRRGRDGDDADEDEDAQPRTRSSSRPQRVAAPTMSLNAKRMSAQSMVRRDGPQQRPSQQHEHTQSSSPDEMDTDSGSY